MSYPLNNHVIEEAPTTIGPQGPIGPRGPEGPQGPQGVQGQKGRDGAMGPMGPQGPKGDRGDIGPQGLRGPRGEQGPQGERGNDGFNGLRGPRGYEGPAGPAGRDGTVQFDELTEEQVESLRGLTGPQGPQGPKGERGLTGIQGPKGEKGDTGATGPAGANGPQGPKGNTGDRGPIGPQGIQGPKGDKGADGMVHSDHVSEGTTWNSKMITDYVLHGKVDWVNSGEGLQVSRHGTANGYIKDLVVRGNTFVNYINNDTFKAPIKSTEKLEDIDSMKDQPQRLLYDVNAGGGLKEDLKLKANTHYTLIFRMSLDRHEIALADTDWVRVFIEYHDGNHEEQYGVLNEGIVKANFKTMEGKTVDKVKVQLFHAVVPMFDDEEQRVPRNVAFTCDKFMLLQGDFTTKLAPRYFWGVRGVGDKISDSTNSRSIKIESRNKNLIEWDNPKVRIDDFYISEDKSSPSRPVYRWVQGNKGDSASYLVYCRQGMHTLTIKAKHGYSQHLRFAVVGYADNPTNGQDGQKLAYISDTDIALNYPSGYISQKIDVTDPNINVLAIYIANVAIRPQDPDYEKDPHAEIPLKNVIEFVQLEEGAVATHYVPYKSIEKELIVPRQLMHGDSLEWDDNMGQYAIHGHDTHGPTIEETGIKEEALLHSFKDMTYLYVKTKIPTVIGATFPLEKNESYTINEWGFEGNDLTQSNEQLKNFLTLPNGFFMQWRDVSVTLDKNNPTSGKVMFLAAKKIIYASATPAALTGGEQNWFSRVIAEIDPRVPHQVNLHLDGDYSSNTQKVNVRVLIISDNRDADE